MSLLVYPKSTVFFNEILSEFLIFVQNCLHLDGKIWKKNTPNISKLHVLQIIYLLYCFLD